MIQEFLGSGVGLGQPQTFPEEPGSEIANETLQKGFKYWCERYKHYKNMVQEAREIYKRTTGRAGSTKAEWDRASAAVEQAKRFRDRTKNAVDKYEDELRSRGYAVGGCIIIGPPLRPREVTREELLPYRPPTPTPRPIGPRPVPLPEYPEARVLVPTPAPYGPFLPSPVGLIARDVQDGGVTRRVAEYRRVPPAPKPTRVIYDPKRGGWVRAPQEEPEGRVPVPTPGGITAEDAELLTKFTLKPMRERYGYPPTYTLETEEVPAPTPTYPRGEEPTYWRGPKVTTVQPPGVRPGALYGPAPFKPGHAALAQPPQADDNVLDSPLVRVATDAGAVVVGGVLVARELRRRKKKPSYFWVAGGAGLIVLGTIRGLYHLTEGL